MPPLEAPTLVGPYQQVGGGMMPIPGQAPLSPAELARQRKNKEIDAKRRQGTQARQIMQRMPPVAPPPVQQPGPAMPAMGAPAPTPVPVAAAKPPPPAPQPVNATDPYIAALQNAQKADQALLNHPYQAPEYKPPNKGMEYIAAGLALLFPGAPIASAAAGMLQGLQQGADSRYQRQEQQAEQTQVGLERTATIADTMARAQGDIQARLEAIKERQAEMAQRHADVMTTLQEKHSEFQQLLPIRSASAQSLINYRIGQLANAAARNTITQQDAQLREQTLVQIAAFREASTNGRHAGDMAMRSAAMQLGVLEKQTDGQIKALDASVAADPTKADSAQAAAAQLIQNEQSQAQKIIGGVSSGRPDVAKIADFAPALPLPSAQPYPGYDQNSGYGGYQAPPGQGGYQLPPNPWGTGGGTPPPQQQVPTRQQAESDSHPQAEPFPNHPSLGKGKGVSVTAFKGALQHYSQASFTSVDALLHDIAASPGSDNLSSAQVEQIVQAWEKAHRAKPATKEGAVPAPGPTPFPVTGGSHATNPFEQVGFANTQAREDISQTAQRLQYGLGYILGPLAPEVTSVSHGKHVENSAHYAHKAVDVGAFDGTPVGENAVTWDAVMRAIASGVFSKIGTIAAIWSNQTAQEFAKAHGVELFHDEGSGPHVHFEVP